MLDSKLLQDDGGSPQRGSDNRQQSSRSPKQDAQWREQPCARFLDLEEVGTEEDQCHADGLVQARGFAERRPGEEQRKGRIEGEQGADQRRIGTRERDDRKQRGCQLRSAEATSAATKMPSTWGRRAVQENGMLPCKEVTEHWLSSRVPASRMGREAALTIQATSAGRASRKRRLFRMGRKEVKVVATSASRAAMMHPSLTAQTRWSSFPFSV